MSFSLPPSELVPSSSGRRIPRIGLGCATFGREITETTAFEIMDYAVEHGVTLFDTAEAYGGGEARAYRKAHLGLDDQREVSGESHSSEKIIGRWLRARGCRPAITIATKVTRNFTRAHLRQSLEASLERLQTDWVDIYLYHRFEPSIPLIEALEAMHDVIAARLTRAGGCSNFTAPQIAEALELCRTQQLTPPTTIEAIYNILQRDIEQELLPLATREELQVLAYSPLAAGFLTGKYSPDRALLPRGTRFDVIPGHIDLYFSPRNFTLVDRLQELARRLDIPPAELATAWALQQGALHTVLAGARSTQHLATALKARELVFRPEWQAEIDHWG